MLIVQIDLDNDAFAGFFDDTSDDAWYPEIKEAFASVMRAMADSPRLRKKNDVHVTIHDSYGFACGYWRVSSR
jgi:hypothetical protein